MESKYYTPDISEFHVGFEYEHCHSSVRFVMLNLKTGEESNATEPKEIWEKSIFSGNEFDIWKSSFKFDDSLRDGQIRVKHLDREGIESLGFTFWYQEFGGTCSIVGSNNKDRDSDEFIGIQFEEDWQGILDGPTITLYSSTSRLFKGVVKNKSELKKVLKMIEYETRQVMDKL